MKGSVGDVAACVCTVGNLAIFEQPVPIVPHPKNLDSQLQWVETPLTLYCISAVQYMVTVTWNGDLVNNLVQPGLSLMLLAISSLHTLVHRLKSPRTPCFPPLRVNAIDGPPLGSGRVTERMQVLQLTINQVQLEKKSFYYPLACPSHCPRSAMAVSK